MSGSAARDWSAFREAYRAGLPNAELWLRLEQADAWTKLPAAQAIEALRNAKTHSNREWLSALNVIYFKWYKKTGYGNDPAGQQQVQALWKKIAAGGGTPEEREAGTRLWVALSLLNDLLQRDPSARAPGSPEDQARAERKSATQQEATQLLGKLIDRPAAIDGMVNVETVRALEGIRCDFAALRARTANDDGGRSDVLYGAANAALALAKSYAILGRMEEAQKAFAESAADFDEAGFSENAAHVRATALTLQRRLRGELDAAAAEKLTELNEVEAQQSDESALKRIESLIELSRIETNVFDKYAALGHAEEAAAELKKLGFVDPSECAIDQALDHWLDVSLKRFGKGGNSLLKLVNSVVNAYRAVYAARYADLIARDAAAAETLLVRQGAMDAAIKTLNAEAAKVGDEREAQMRDFFPAQLPIDPQISAGKSAQAANADETSARMQKIDTALAAVRDRCNARTEAKAPMDDLLAELADLKTTADALGVPIYAAKVRLEIAYVWRALEQPRAMAAAARDARERLLAGRKESVWSFTEGYERITFLDTYRREVEAAMLAKNSEEVAAISRGVISDFETLRYNVRDPYRAASLLIHVVDFYERAIFAAYKLQRWDDLLETMELIKARSALRRRGEAAGRPSEDTGQIAELAAEFEHLSQDQGRDPAVAKRRRQVWDLLSITRSRQNAAALPEFSLEALQKTLRADEAVVGYFWLTESVFLTICIDAGRCEVERVVLSDEQLETWVELFAFARNLRFAAGRSFDRAVERAGTFFLPAKVREFVRGKERVAFSPHRGLHLFPFHAVPWSEGEFLGARFAVRYVPNFSSVMLPWIHRYESRFFGLAIEQFGDPAIPPLAKVEADLRTVEVDYAAAQVSTKAVFGAGGTRSEFNRWRELPEFTRARCVHFGTHGISVLKSPDEPLEARLLLQDGWVDCMDIAQTSVSAEVVVLSACDSGQQSMDFRKMATGGPGVPGDEIFGLQSTFFQAGARCVLGALWLVETESSSKLIRLFHEQFARGGEVDIALRDAVRVYLSDPSSSRGIFYWAPYFLSCLGAAPR